MSSFSGKTVLVTGAGGYVGRSVLKALRKLDAIPVALELSPTDLPDAEDVVIADVLGDQADLMRTVEQLSSDVCIHLAWRDGFKHNSYAHMADLSGHYRFLESLIQLGVPRVVGMGSMHEVGYWEGAIDEETPCNPGSMYGIAKDALRRAFFLAARNSNVEPLWLRGYYIYGNDAMSQSIFGKIARAAARGERTFPFTSGKNRYDFIHVDELGLQIAACALTEGETGIVNCCTGSPETLASRIERYIAENGFDIELEYGAYPDRPYDSPGVWGDSSRIESILSRYGLQRSAHV